MASPLSQLEVDRLAALQRYAVLDTLPEAAFDRIVKLAAEAFQVPIALITFIDGTRQWFKARHGFTLDQIAREVSLCLETLAGTVVHEVPDASVDPLYIGNPLVAGPPHLRFYAGAPLRDPNGHNVGTIALLDVHPRHLTASERQLLSSFAELVIQTLELRLQTQQGEAEVKQVSHELAERFQLVSRATSDAVWDWDLGTNRLWWSEGFRTLFGYREDQIEPGLESWTSRLHPDDSEQLLASIHEVLDGGGVSWSGEYRFLRSNGTWADIFDRGYVMHDEAKKPVRMIGAMMDISERKRDEKARHALHRIAEAASGAVTQHEMLRQIHQIVSELMPAPNLYIALYDEASGQVLFPYLVDERDHDVTPQPLGRGMTEYVLRTGAPVLHSRRDEFEELVSRGEVVLVGPPAVSWLGVPLKSGEQTFGVLVAQSYSEGVIYGEREKELLLFVSTQVARAIERKKADDERRQSEARFRALIENSTDGIALMLADGTVLYRSPSTVRMLGRPVLDAEGGLLKNVHPEDRAAGEQHWATVVQSPGVALPSSIRVMHAEGSWRVLDCVTVNLLHDPAVRGIVSNFRDVTERKQLEARLMMGDRMASVGTLAAGVAHEINNPLAYIQGNLDFALDRLGQSAEQQDLGSGVRPGQRGEQPQPLRDDARAEVIEALREAREGTGRVRVIVRDLKTFSRPDETVLGALDVRAVLESTLHMAWNEIRHRARLVKNFGPAPLVLANESRLGQIFLNLLLNAAQAIREGAADANQITVTTSTDPAGRAVISIKDTGTGMTPDVQRRIFDPFFTTKPIGVGTGLGLSICQGIVTSLSGEISVQSEPGKGSEFRVVLPPTRLETSPEPGAPLEVSLRRGHILVVDDEPMVGRAILRMLSADHEVKVVPSGKEALRDLLGGGQYDLILCDLMMPEVTGMDLHGELVRLDPAMAERMLFLTGGAFTTSAREFLERVPNPRLEKPFNAAELRALVRTQLR